MKIKMVREFMLLRFLLIILVFLDSKGTNTSSNDFNSLPEPPREDSVSSSSNMNNMETVSVDKDPFEAFGDSIEISDNDLPF